MHNMNEAQRNLYFEIIQHLPEEFYDVSKNDLEPLFQAIDNGESISPKNVLTLRRGAEMLRLIKEISTWDGNDRDAKRDDLLLRINKLLEKNNS